MRRAVLALALALLVSPARSSAAVITFSGLLPPSSLTTYAEAGFQVKSTAGQWMALGYGTPAPSVVFLDAVAGVTIGQLEVTAAGSLFTFASVNLYSSVTPIPYVFTGIRNAGTVFTASGTVPNTLGNFVTVSSTPQQIDTLLITLSNPPTNGICCGLNPMGLDNIVVTAVPEPSTMVLLAAGLALAVRRRTQRI